MSQSTRRYIIVFAVVLAAVALFFIYTELENESIRNATKEGNAFQRLSATFREDIHKRGAAEAYAQFLKDAPERTDIDPHTQAHLFGEVLYELQGIEGLSLIHI